jgi:hypothetical protein
LIGARNPKLSLRFENSGGRNANVVIILKSRADKTLKFLVLEDFPPFLVTERSRSAAGSGKICRGRP